MTRPDIDRGEPGPGKKIEVMIGSGAVVIPFHFGRPSVASEDMRRRLGAYEIAGARIINGWKMSDEDCRRELDIIAREPEDKPPHQILGFIVAQEGLAQFEQPFLSLNDRGVREVFRAIADPQVNNPYFSPSRSVRAALFNDKAPRVAWHPGEVDSQLRIALAESGRVFHSIDEHSHRMDPAYTWPGIMAGMLGAAYLLGEGNVAEESKGRVAEKIGSDLTYVERFAATVFTEGDREQLVGHVNNLAKDQILTA